MLIGTNATFTCDTIGTKEVNWVLNDVPMSVSYLDRMQQYEDNGVVFAEDKSQYHYNLTMTIPAIVDFNKTNISCFGYDKDFYSIQSDKVHLIVVGMFLLTLS